MLLVGEIAGQGGQYVSDWLVPASDVNALADALGDVFAAPIERIAAMSEAGRRRVHEEHDASREAAKLKLLFETCGEATTAKA